MSLRVACCHQDDTAPQVDGGIVIIEGTCCLTTYRSHQWLLSKERDLRAATAGPPVSTPTADLESYPDML